MKIESVVIFVNTSKTKSESVASDMQRWLCSKGKKVTCINLSSTEKDNLIEPPVADLAISLGGDGTVLSCARILKNSGIPLLAVHLGSFGYITDTTADEFRTVFEDFENGRTGLQKRLMLDVDVLRNEKSVYKTTVLNEITVSSADRAKLVRLDLHINGILAAKLRGDGIIIATPTGSTAYSLAAGGPVLDSTLEGIIVNPVCPFAMSVRPVVVSSASVIEIKVSEVSEKALLSADGHSEFKVMWNDAVRVTRSPDYSFFVENRNRQFIAVLRDKLGWAGGFTGA